MKIVIKEWLRDPKSCLLMLIYLIFSILYILVDALIIKLIGDCLEDISNPLRIWNLVIAAVIAVILSTLTGYMNPYITRCAVFTTLYKRWVGKMLSADYDLFASKSEVAIDHAGDFMRNLIEVGRDSVRAVLQVINIVVLLGSMFLVIGWKIWLIIVIYLISIIIMKAIYNKTAKTDKECQNDIKTRDQDYRNIMNGFQEVRCFNTQEYHRREIYDLTDKIKLVKGKKIRFISILHGSIETVEKLGMIVVILYAVSEVANGSLTQATAMTLVMYSLRILGPVIWLLDFTDELSEDLSLSKDYQEVINYQNKMTDGDITLSEFRDDIKIDNVSFAYGDSANTLSNLSITIHKGEHIGICGESGGGKSTLFKLLNRFYDVNNGSISIDGIDIRDITRKSYFGKISSVCQENIIFPGTIRENISYGLSNVMESEIIEAAKKARLYDFIMGLPDKFETQVGPRGLKLSGGQRQRIALARVFIRKPNIILLDEATSALDNESERAIQEAIDECDATVICIAHRLSTIKNSNCIYVVGNHGIIESGTHDELMKHNAVYAKMYGKED